MFGAVEVEAGIGYGLKAGVAEGPLEAQIGGKWDVVNVKINNSGIKMEQEDELVAKISIAMLELGPHDKNFFDLDTETYDKNFSWYEESETINIVGMDFYTIIGFNVNLDFNYVTFFNSAIAIFNE